MRSQTELLVPHSETEQSGHEGQEERQENGQVGKKRREKEGGRDREEGWGQRIAKIAPNYQWMKETSTAIPWSLPREHSPAGSSAVDRWDPELWLSMSAMSHSLTLKCLVAAPETITINISTVSLLTEGSRETLTWSRRHFGQRSIKMTNLSWLLPVALRLPYCPAPDPAFQLSFHSQRKGPLPKGFLSSVVLGGVAGKGGW